MEYKIYLTLYFFIFKHKGNLLNSFGGDEPGFFRLGAAIGDGGFLLGTRDRTTGVCRLFNDVLRDLGLSILCGAAFSLDRCPSNLAAAAVLFRRLDNK